MGEPYYIRSKREREREKEKQWFKLCFKTFIIAENLNKLSKFRRGRTDMWWWSLSIEY